MLQVSDGAIRVAAVHLVPFANPRSNDNAGHNRRQPVQLCNTVPDRRQLLVLPGRHRIQWLPCHQPGGLPVHQLHDAVRALWLCLCCL